MRIVSGDFRGRAIAAPEGSATRPTSDRARQAVFNILEHAAWSNGVRGQRVIDLFAGSGALGFEALSRGAAFCLFVETDEAARGAIRENVAALDPSGGLFGVTRVHRRDATDLGIRPGADGEILPKVEPPGRLAITGFFFGLAQPALYSFFGAGSAEAAALACARRG